MKHYRADIDGLRAVAVIIVVLFHYFPSVMPGGFTGVDVFFVISGFLISSVIVGEQETKNFSVLGFYKRRVLRIFPALITLLVAILIVGWFTLVSFEYQTVAKHVTAAAVFASNFLLWRDATAYFGFSAASFPLLHLWSLAIEEQFYLLYPWLLLAISQRAKQAKAVLLIGAVSFIAAYFLYANDATGSFFNPLCRFWELCIGCAIFFFEGKLKKISGTGEGIALFGLALIVGSGYFVTWDLGSRGWPLLMPTVGAALVILGGGGNSRVNRLLALKPLVYIGKISYPLYLWHWALLSLSLVIEAGEVSTQHRIALVSAAFVLAALTYHLIEKPIRFGQWKSLALMRNRAPALAVLLVITGGLGAAVHSANGVAERSSFSQLGRDTFRYDAIEKCDRWAGESYYDDYCHGNEHYLAPDVVVIGDSHANAYAPMFDELMEGTGLNFIQLGRGQCSMFLAPMTLDCDRLSKKAFEYVSRTPSVKAVVISNRWERTLRLATAERDEATIRAFYQALGNTIQGYKRLGKKVFLLLSPPPSFNPRACIDRPLKFSSTKSCDYPIKEAYSERIYMKSLVESLKDQGLDGIFDPFAAFCNENVCRMMIEGRLLYNDETHLSVDGGKYLATRYRNWFSENFFSKIR